MNKDDKGNKGQGRQEAAPVKEDIGSLLLKGINDLENTELCDERLMLDIERPLWNKLKDSLNTLVFVNSPCSRKEGLRMKDLVRWILCSKVSAKESEGRIRIDLESMTAERDNAVEKHLECRKEYDRLKKEYRNLCTWMFVQFGLIVVLVILNVCR